jgi:uroporphyrinogen-III synthase
VAYVGAGPGDPGLLTERGRRRLGEAEVVVADARVPEAILDLAPEGAERIRARGPAAGRLAIEAAAGGRRVVRLLPGGGGRAAAEAPAAARAGLPVEVVPGVARAAARAALAPRPLEGRRIVVTRPRHQAAALATRLEDAGAEVVSLPTIRLLPPEDWGPLDAAVRDLARYRWVLFTSANGVEAFGARLRGAGRDARALAAARLGVIGPATAEALARLGLAADVVPAEYRAEGLLEALPPEVGAGCPVLLVRAAEARDALPAGLRGRGAEVTVAPAYRTVPVAEAGPRLRRLLARPGVDAVTFTSPSTVHGFLGLLAPADRPRLLAGVTLAAIGPITAAALAGHGLPATVVAPEYTGPALAAALASHLGPRGPAHPSPRPGSRRDSGGSAAPPRVEDP